MEANDFKISQVEATFHLNEGTALNVLISNLAVLYIHRSHVIIMSTLVSPRPIHMAITLIRMTHLP